MHGTKLVSTLGLLHLLATVVTSRKKKNNKIKQLHDMSNLILLFFSKQSTYMF